MQVKVIDGNIVAIKELEDKINKFCSYHNVKNINVIQREDSPVIYAFVTYVK